MTCAPGGWLRNQIGAEPASFVGLIETIESAFMPKVDVAEHWRFLLAAHGPVFAPLSKTPNKALSADFQRTLFAPHAVTGYVVGFCLDAQQTLVGHVSIGARIGSKALLQAVRAPLLDLVATAGHTLAACLSLAEGCGAVVPRHDAFDAKLTPREKQVLQHVLEGATDLNVSARLNISEDTVGTHLKKVFRKLGVHSRAELITRLGARG